ncbi:MAG TPA: hypothetical protein VF495_25650 [Phenylobacterium sp.]
MISIDTLTSTWNALSPEAQLAQWETFIADLDGGCGGFHVYYRVLMPLWDQGDVPDRIEAAQLAKYEDEMRTEHLWALQHPSTADLWMDYGIRQLDPATADIDLDELPY